MYVDSPGDHSSALRRAAVRAVTRSDARSPARPAASVGRRMTQRSATGGAGIGPQNLVLAAAGSIRHATARAAERLVRGRSRSRQRRPAAGPLERRAPAPPGSIRVAFRTPRRRGTCASACRAWRAIDPDRWALDLLGAVLGDGMSSRLFLELRERRSLAYDSRPSRHLRGLRHVRDPRGLRPRPGRCARRRHPRAAERVVQEPVTPASWTGPAPTPVAASSSAWRRPERSPAWLGTGESLLPRILTLDEVIERFAAITTDDLLRVARRLSARRTLGSPILRPFRGARRFERLLAR